MRLLIDSSGPQLVCALAEEGIERVVAETICHAEAAKLRPIDALVSELLGHCTVADIYSIVVGVGPGSFIGTRTAISFANGFAAASNAELFGVNSLAAIAAGTGRLPVPPVLRDARRGQWYLWLNDTDCNPHDEAGVLAALTLEVSDSVVLEWGGQPEPPLAETLRGAGLKVEIVAGVTGEGLLRSFGNCEPQPYIEPIYLRGFT